MLKQLVPGDIVQYSRISIRNYMFSNMAYNMVRYGFNIRTRSGQRVDNISIIARDQLEAERRLRQMYQQCEIVDCNPRPVSAHTDPIDIGGLAGLAAAAAESADKPTH